MKEIDVGNCRNGFFHWKGSHNLLSILKDVECTDFTVGTNRKMLNLLFAVGHPGQLLVSPLCSSSSNIQRCLLSGGVWLTKEEGMVAPPFMNYSYLIGLHGRCDLIDGRIAAIFGHGLGNVILPPFFASEKTYHLFSFVPCQGCRQTPTLGRG